MNARAIDGLKPPTQKELLSNLRKHVVKMLGVNDRNRILDHAVGHACMELEVLVAALTGHADVDSDSCGFAIRGVIDRLLLARELQGGMWDPEHPEETIILEGGES